MNVLFWRKRTEPPVPVPPVEGRLHTFWHAETLWCAFRGHDVPAFTARSATEASSLIALPLANEALVARCVRCDVWLIADPAAAEVDVAPALKDVRLPKRGKALRDAIVLKVIAVDRGVHAIVFALAAVALLVLETHLGSWQSSARHLFDNTQSTLSNTGQESGRSFTIRQLQHFINIKPTSLYVLMGTALVYAVVEGVEAIGLWMEKRWAEYLTAVATAGFMPLEIHELIKRITVLRVGALVINIAVLIYLVFAKRLFGVRGGVHEDDLLLRSAEHLHALPGQPSASE